MTADRLEQIEENFKRRYRQKKILNLSISAVVLVLGVFSVIFIFNYDQEGILTFRWMTVDATIFTTVMSGVFIVVSQVEMYRFTEVTSKPVYYIRLSSAVAESMTIVIVLLSQLPVFPEHMHILRPDMFCMHIAIPILTVASFVINDSPIGRTDVLSRINGLWFINVYAITITLLIISGIILPEQVPYFFLDVLNTPLLSVITYYAILYVMAYSLLYLLYRLNRKLSWMWFKGVTIY